MLNLKQIRHFTDKALAPRKGEPRTLMGIVSARSPAAEGRRSKYTKRQE